MRKTTPRIGQPSVTSASDTAPHHLSEEDLIAFTHNRHSDPESVELHLLSCRPCLESAEQMQALIKALGDEEKARTQWKVMRAGS